MSGVVQKPTLQLHLLMFQRMCQVPTLREFGIARQGGLLAHRDKDWLDDAPHEYEALLEVLAGIDLVDEFAFLQADADTHRRLAGYYERVAASYGVLVRRVRGVLGLVTEPA